MLKNQSLQRELEDKEKIIQNHQQMLESMRQSKSNLEEQLGCLKATDAKKDSKIDEMREEIKNGNEFIKKVQADLKAYKQKLKLHTTVIKQQEQSLK